MAGIWTRKNINEILNNADLTPEERADQLFSLHSRAIDDGYVTKQAADLAKSEAVAAALKDAPKPPEVKVKETDDYKALEAEFAAYKDRQEARRSDDYKGVKGKFFDAVYDRIDRSDGAKPLDEQIKKLREDFEEFFDPADPEPAKPGAPAPHFGAPTQGSAPTGSKGNSFADAWGFGPKK